MSLRIELPWPISPLWPNRRVHWSKKAAATRKAKSDAFVLTNSAIWAGWQKAAVRRIEKPVVTLSFRPPTKCRYDLDNALAACKGALDGIAESLATDDSHFSLVLKRGEPVKGGKVIVEIGT
jgi:crossover junction endodeoxyribonuclease RusA